MNLTRRAALSGGLAFGLVGVEAFAEDDVLLFEDMRIHGVRGLGADILAPLRAQITMVRALRISDDAKAFLKGVPVRIDPTLKQSGYADASGVRLRNIAFPADNPVLLHEFMHVYHGRKLPDGFANATVRTAFQTARASGDWPANAYMLSNPREFFAMTASVALHGRAARPPGARARLVARMPDYVSWIDGTFGFTLT